MKTEQLPHRYLDRSLTLREIIFALALLACVSPWVSPPLALLLGVGIAQFVGHPYPELNSKATHGLLQISVVGLGFGMNVHSALNASRSGLGFTVVSIALTLGLGLLLGKIFKVDAKIAYLISVGTAICGGSAIAAVSPVIKAEEKQISVALGVVFVLNSAALFLFPYIGEWLHLSQTQFGLWCAIAIHDTSSVIGAASKYGSQALEIATTIKLARALWIIPVGLASALTFGNQKQKIHIPYFIGLFVLAMLANTYVPVVQAYSHYAVSIAKVGLTLTLFLIGCGLSQSVLKTLGIRPVLQGVLLWVFISGITLLGILSI